MLKKSLCLMAALAMVGGAGFAESPEGVEKAQRFQAAPSEATLSAPQSNHDTASPEPECLSKTAGERSRFDLSQSIDDPRLLGRIGDAQLDELGRRVRYCWICPWGCC